MAGIISAIGTSVIIFTKFLGSKFEVSYMSDIFLIVTFTVLTTMNLVRGFLPSIKSTPEEGSTNPTSTTEPKK
ncbi:MAG: hypothetical protein WCK31_04930 [bacterium]